MATTLSGRLAHLIPPQGEVLAPEKGHVGRMLEKAAGREEQEARAGLNSGPPKVMLSLEPHKGIVFGTRGVCRRNELRRSRGMRASPRPSMPCVLIPRDTETQEENTR